MERPTSALDYAKQKKRIFDQMATMHFKLHDKYKNYSTIETVIEILISIILCGCTFLDLNILFPQIRIESSLIAGLTSIGLFAYTFVKQALGHDKKSEKHYNAGKLFSKAKLDLNNKIVEWESSQSSDKEIFNFISNRYEIINDQPQIPEKYFAKLKHYHQEKVEFSKFLDEHRREFYPICKIKFRMSKAKANALNETPKKQKPKA